MVSSGIPPLPGGQIGGQVRIRHHGLVTAQEGKSGAESRIFAKEILEQVPLRKLTRSFFPEGRDTEIPVDPTSSQSERQTSIPADWF